MDPSLFVLSDSITQPKPKLSVQFYADLYWGTAFRPGQSQLPYLVSHQRTGGPQVNLVAADIQFKAHRWRSRFVPAWGTYMQANYAAEPKGLAQHLVEASVGFRPLKQKNIWIEAGLLSSPITNENAFSLDQLLLTRSFAPEFSPYFLTGAKLVVPFGKKWTGSLYVVNGWQTIRQQNKNWGLVGQVEFKPTDQDVWNANVYTANEEKTGQAFLRQRFLFDLYWTHQGKGKWQFSSNLYWGQQALLEPIVGQPQRFQWWQANVQARYRLHSQWWLAGRTEYFSDPHARIVPVNSPGNAFQQWSQTLGLQTLVAKKLLWRVEYRYAWGPTKVYEDQEGKASSQQHWLLVGLACRF